MSASIVNDSLQSILKLQNDTILHKVLVITNEKSDFFTMDNPIWFVATFVIGLLFSYLISLKQKRNESITEAKKALLEKRINLHENLLCIFSKSLIVTALPSDITKVYYRIFTSTNGMEDWFDELLTFTNDNKVFISKNVNYNLNLINNLRKHLHHLIENLPMNDNSIKEFAIEYHKEFEHILKRTEKSIIDFFENEISIDFKYNKLSETDLKKIRDELYKYTMISNNFHKDSPIT